MTPFGGLVPEAAVATRAGAIEALLEILSRRVPSEHAIARAAQKFELVGKARAFMAQMVFGVLKNLAYIDHVLRALLSEGKFPSDVCTFALRVGGYQLGFGGVAPYAAVDTTVDALRHLGGHPKELALANAVLRKFAKRWREIPLPEEETKRLAVKYSHPLWLVRRWVRRYGASFAEAMLAANNADPPKTFRVNALRAKPERLLEKLRSKGYDLRPSVFPGYVNLVGGPPAGRFVPFVEGLLTVQDAAFAIPVMLLRPNRGETILDLCAAPGGKTTHITELLGGEVDGLFALDNDAQRMAMLVDNIVRLRHPRPNLIVGDGIKPPFPRGVFDKILVDAPCTALGVIRRHPEIRWLRTPADCRRMGRIQRMLLGAAEALLKPGGIVVFTTCTTEPEENEAVVRFGERLGFSVVPVEDELLRRFLTSDGFVRTFPHRDGVDASFSVALRKAR